MKRLLYTIISLFILVGCHQDNIELSQQPPTDGEKVTISLSVQIPEAQSAMSRAFNDDGSNIDKLCLVVFNENNYLSEVAWAEDYTAEKDEVCFKVNLKPSGSTRYIHFIAYKNDDVADTEDIKDELTTQLNNIQYGAEATIMSALNVSGTKDAYWQRLELPEIRNNDETKNAMRRVPLVRNFAKITVTNNAGNFAITRIAVVTPPSKGSIAPYFDGDFAVFNDAKAPRSYETILGTGYNGYSPSDYLPNNNELGQTVAWGENATSVSTYLYERNQRTNTDKLTYLLIAGRYNGGEVSYYKLDLVDANGDRYNILRNFNYEVTITSVVGDGLSYENALANAPGNNISGSVEAQNFLNISDGTGQLFVSYVKKTIVSDDAVTLMYKYIPNLNTDNDNDGNPDVKNAAVTITPQVKTSDNVFASKASGINGYDIVQSSTDETGENAGWRTITIKPNKPGDNPLTQILTLKGGSLQRTITYTLREAYNLIAQCTEEVSDEMNSEMEVYIYIPTDLPDYIFPLTFFIEADKRSIYPDAAKDNMYTSFGPSNNEDRTENTFGFDKELSLSDYDDLDTETIYGVTYKKITCHFLTNIDESASDIYVYNELFNLGKCKFENVTLQEFTETSISTSIVGIEQTVTYSFKTETDANVTINIIEGNQRTTVTKEVKGNLKNEFTYKTQTWGQGIEIILSAYGYLPTTMEGRRTLIIPVQNLKATNIRESYNNYVSGVSISDVSVYADSNHSQLIGTIKFNSDGNMSSDLTLDVTGLNDDNHLYFTYTATEWKIMSSSSKTYSTNATIRDILKEDGIKLTFVEQ